MPRRLLTLSDDARTLLDDAVRHEYLEIELRSLASARHASSRSMVMARKAARDLRRVAWIDRKFFAFSLPIASLIASLESRIPAPNSDTRRTGRPARFPHFTAAALRLRAQGVPRIAIARHGFRLLPGLLEHETVDDIDALLKQAERRKGGQTRPVVRKNLR